MRHEQSFCGGASWLRCAVRVDKSHCEGSCIYKQEMPPAKPQIGQ